MNINLFNNCYNIAALSTILLKENEFERRAHSKYDEGYIVPITENLNVITHYYRLLGHHCFGVDFERDGKYLSDISYHGSLVHDLGWLSSDSIAMPIKIDAIYKLKPKIKDRVKALATTTYLTEEEINAIIIKSQELTGMAREFVKSEELSIPYKSKNFSSSAKQKSEKKHK